jgi:hypothetical protein
VEELHLAETGVAHLEVRHGGEEDIIEQPNRSERLTNERIQLRLKRLELGRKRRETHLGSRPFLIQIHLVRSMEEMHRGQDAHEHHDALPLTLRLLRAGQIDPGMAAWVVRQARQVPNGAPGTLCSNTLEEALPVLGVLMSGPAQSVPSLVFLGLSVPRIVTMKLRREILMHELDEGLRGKTLIHAVLPLNHQGRISALFPA